jgi:hypothetical protein
VSQPCDVLLVETELDLIDGRLAVELPAHMRAFARAHAEGRSPPPAPPLLRLASTLQTARHALTHDLLVDRGVALVRLVVPLAIESDGAVVAARAQPPSWAGLQRLAAARDAVALRMFGHRAIELLHWLHGADGAPRDHAAPGPAIEGWSARGPAVDGGAIVDVWQAIAARFGVGGNVRVDRSAKAGTAQPRAFVVEPKREVVVVVPPAIDTPAKRFAVLHELGHAFVALAMSPGTPRVVDEAAASYVARFMEPPSWLPPKWPSPLAETARQRRLALAAALDAIERRLPELDGDAEALGAAPSWGLWHDPGAQAAYVAAEAMVDRMRTELGPKPPAGQVLRALVAERDRIDLRAPIVL